MNAVYLLIALGIFGFLLRSRYPIRAILTSDGVSSSEGISKSLRAKLARFAQENLEPGQSIKLRGKVLERGRIRWSFPRSVDPGFAQRFRNFMANEVYM